MSKTIERVDQSKGTMSIDGRAVPFLLNMSLAQFLERVAKVPETPPKPRPPKTPAPSMGDPTPERRGKEPNGFGELTVRPGTVYTAAQVLHRVREPLDLYGDYFSKTELAVAEIFVADAEAASIVHVTSNWSGMPGIGAGARAGGVQDSKRARYLRFMDVLDALPEEMRSILAHLVLCVRHEASGKPATVQDVGRALIGGKTEPVNRGVGIGYLKATLVALHAVYRAREVARRR